MAVAVESHSIPQPAQADNIPQNSKQVSSDSQIQKPLAFREFYPQEQAAAAMPHQQMPQVKLSSLNKTSAYESYIKPAVLGLGSMGALAAGANYIRKKRRDKINRARDEQWRREAMQQALQLTGQGNLSNP